MNFVYLIIQTGTVSHPPKWTELEEEINKPTNMWWVLIPPSKSGKTRSEIKNLEYLKPYTEGK